MLLLQLQIDVEEDFKGVQDGGLPVLEAVSNFRLVSLHAHENVLYLLSYFLLKVHLNLTAAQVLVLALEQPELGVRSHKSVQVVGKRVSVVLNCSSGQRQRLALLVEDLQVLDIDEVEALFDCFCGLVRVSILLLVDPLEKEGCFLDPELVQHELRPYKSDGCLRLRLKFFSDVE